MISPVSTGRPTSGEVGLEVALVALLFSCVVEMCSGPRQAWRGVLRVPLLLGPASSSVGLVVALGAF